MSKKYNPDTWYWPKWDRSLFQRAWNHWLNPLGNWQEPMPIPQRRVDEAYKSLLFKIFGDPWGPWLWWSLRNHLSNFKAHWIGIRPIGERYDWLDPAVNGWERVQVDTEGASHTSYWKKKIGPLTIKLPYWSAERWGWQFGLGWKDSGGFGGHFRRD